MSKNSLPVSFSRRIPEDDDRERLVCDQCGHIAYENPKIVVGSVAIHEGRVLLCRRAIEPRRGFWTLPAGYLELGESPEEGTLREAREEACVTLEIDQLLAVYSITRISQVQLIYRARLASPKFAPGPESQEVELFDFDALPVNELAFPSVQWALDDYQASRDKADFPPSARSDDAAGGL